MSRSGSVLALSAMMLLISSCATAQIEALDAGHAGRVLAHLSNAYDDTSDQRLTAAIDAYNAQAALRDLLTPVEHADVLISISQIFLESGCPAGAVDAARLAQEDISPRLSQSSAQVTRSRWDRALRADYTAYTGMSASIHQALMAARNSDPDPGDRPHRACADIRLQSAESLQTASAQSGASPRPSGSRPSGRPGANLPPTASAPPPPDMTPQYQGMFETVRLFWGTNRGIEGPDPERNFNNRRSELQYGEIEVSVPHDRAPGSIPRPGVLDFRGARDGVHMVLRPASTIGASGFEGALGAALADGEAQDMFVFIHGHAVTFAQAALQTAQLAVDLDMRAGATFFSWPNGHSVASYQVSQNGVDPSALALDRFLMSVIEEAGERRVHVIAHSMGARVLLRSLERLAARGAFNDGPLLGEVIWASPDVDAEYFGQSLRELPRMANGMTAYMSRHDRALQLSSMLGGQFRRAGQSIPLPSIAQVVVAVDTSDVSSGIGHGDFAAGALNDLKAIVWLSLPPEGRCILAAEQIDQDAQFWRAVDNRPECEPALFSEALNLARLLGAPEALERLDKSLADMQPDSPNRTRVQALLSILEPLRAQ